jgi:hypothetical protein
MRAKDSFAWYICVQFVQNTKHPEPNTKEQLAKRPSVIVKNANQKYSNHIPGTLQTYPTSELPKSQIFSGYLSYDYTHDCSNKQDAIMNDVSKPLELYQSDSEMSQEILDEFGLDDEHEDNLMDSIIQQDKVWALL